MQQLNPVALVLEASGGLELPLEAAAKADSLDAAVLAHFAEAVRPPLRPLRDAETQVLSSLVARR